MSNYHQSVNAQYGRDNLSERVIRQLIEAGKDPGNLTRSDLSTFDEFHIGGLMETRNFASKIPNLGKDTEILDVGSGLGGPARTLADEYGCNVTGIDLTVEYCDVATKLTSMVGLSDRINFRHGDATEMPFEDNSFDIVWTQFAAMNIEDKQRLYTQCQRVLRPGGYLAFHEVLAGEKPGLIFPVFWADDEDINFLRTVESIQGTLEATGFKKIRWDDLTQTSSDWFQKMLTKPKQQTAKPLGFNVFVGESTPQKAANVIRNLDEGRIKVVQAVYQKK